jgi:hypothetical protein
MSVMPVNCPAAASRLCGGPAWPTGGKPEHPFLRGYTAATGLVLDDAARTRLALYRVHLHVLMLAEGPSRGIPVGSERHDYVTGLLHDELSDL